MKKTISLVIFTMASLFLALNVTSCGSGQSQAVTSWPKQPLEMFVAAENSYTSVNIPAAIQIPNFPDTVKGIAGSQNIYLGWNDSITIKLTTDSWQGGCNISLWYVHPTDSSMRELRGQEAIVSQTNPGRYEVTLSRKLERGSSNVDEGMYQIHILNSMSQTIHANIIYSRQ
jgi:hypothetical protein